MEIDARTDKRRTLEEAAQIAMWGDKPKVILPKIDEPIEKVFERQLPIYNMTKIDEKADLKGNRPEDMVDDEKPEFDSDLTPEPTGIDSKIKKLPFGKGFGNKPKNGKINLYRFPRKPIPEAAKLSKIYEVLKNWDSWGIKKIHRPYFLCTYLFAGRTSEMIGARRQDFDILERSGREFLQGKFITLKTRGGNMIRNPVVPFDGPEGAMVEELCKHANNFSSKENLFSLDRKTAWHQMHRINYGPLTALKVEKGKKSFIRLDDWYGNSHYLRHCRCTSLVEDYGFSVLTLQNFIGWQDLRMASRYVHLDVQNIVDAFVKKLG